MMDNHEVLGIIIYFPDFRLNSWQLITDVPRVYYVGEVGWHLRGVVSQDNIGQIVLRSIQTSIQ